MKKNNLNKKDCLDCQRIGEIFKKGRDKMKAKFEEGRTYAKNNPKKSKTILAGVGAFVIAVVAFLLGRKTNNDEDKK